MRFNETAAPATSPRQSAADVARALMSDRREPGCGSGAATAGATTGDGTATEAGAGRGTKPAARLRWNRRGISAHGRPRPPMREARRYSMSGRGGLGPAARLPIALSRAPQMTCLNVRRPRVPRAGPLIPSPRCARRERRGRSATPKSEKDKGVTWRCGYTVPYLSLCVF
jgi:hypothetical protein